MLTRRLSRDEIGIRGTEIYECQLRSTLDATVLDQFVAIDVETAEYEVADEAHLAGYVKCTKKLKLSCFYLLFGERLMAQLTTTSKLAEQVAKRMVPKRLVPS